MGLKEEGWQRLLTNREDSAYLAEIAGRAKAVHEILELPYEAMVSFYSKEEDNATEVNQDERS